MVYFGKHRLGLTFNYKIGGFIYPSVTFNTNNNHKTDRQADK